MKQKRLFIWCTKQNDLTKFFKLSNCFKGELLIIHLFFRSLKRFFFTFHCVKIRKVKRKEICTFLYHKGPKISCENHSDKQIFFELELSKAVSVTRIEIVKTLMICSICFNLNHTCWVQGDLIRALRRLNEKLSEEPNSL